MLTHVGLNHCKIKRQKIKVNEGKEKSRTASPNNQKAALGRRWEPVRTSSSVCPEHDTIPVSVVHSQVHPKSWSSQNSLWFAKQHS